MNPYILIVGFFTFSACFLLHILWWRMRRPKSDITALVSVFIVIPFIFILLAYKLHVMALTDLVSVALLHIALSGAYIMSYPAVQAKCPSLNIMLTVNHSMPAGATREEIKQSLGGDALFDAMVKKMIEEKFVKEDSGILIPTKLGKVLAVIFISFRYVLGADQGKG